jgi:DNA-binding NarL/FixJ family response regulator
MLTDALKSVLEPRCEVVATVRDGRALLEAAANLQPDIIVLDIGMPKLNGLEAARQIRLLLPKVRLIFLTMNQDPYLVGEAFRAGASAFVMKQAAALELTDAIEKVLKGGTFLTPSAVPGLDEISLRAPRSRARAPEPTPRQREVIRLLAEGYSMKEVAAALKITPRTVAAHKYGVLKLLNLKTNAELIQYAIKHKIIFI